MDARYIFVDFDNTIYLWYYDESNVRMEPSAWIAEMLKGKCPYKPERLNKTLIQYLRYRKEQYPDTKIILLTQGAFSTEGKYKFGFLNDNVPDLFDDWICVATREAKVTMMEAYVGAGVPKNRILLVDDTADILKMAHAKGFTCVTPQLLMDITGDSFL